MITGNVVNDAYEQLCAKEKYLFDASYSLASIKDALETEVSKGLADGVIIGKNQQLRDAAARELLPELFDAVTKAQNVYDKTRLDYTLAQNEVSRVRLIIRLMEIVKEK